MAIKYSIRHLHFQNQQKKQHKNNLSNIFKVSNKNTRTKSGASVINSEHILHFILLLSLLGWVWESKVSDNKSVFGNCGKYIVLWAGKIWWAHVFNIIHPAGIYMFKVNNRNTRRRCKICFKVNNKDTRTSPLVSFWCLYC